MGHYRGSSYPLSLCQDKELKLHRVIVYSKSRPLVASMSGRYYSTFAVTILFAPAFFLHFFQDIETITYEFLQNESADIEKMITPELMPSFTMTQFSSDVIFSDLKNIGGALESIQMYILGDQYDIPGLKQMATANLRPLSPNPDLQLLQSSTAKSRFS